MNRKQRRAEGKTSKSTTDRSKSGGSSLLEETLFRQALEHHQAGRLRDAEAGYRNILANNSRHAGALGFLGLLAHQAGHSDAGIDLLKKAIASDRQNPELQYNLACILSDCRRDDEAILHYRKALALKPDYPEAHNNFGALLLMRGRPIEALATVIQGLQTEATINLKSTFVMIVRSLDPTTIQIEQNFIQFLIRALNEPWCRPRDLSGIAGSILARNSSITNGQSRISHTQSHRLNELFSSEDLASINSDGLLHALLTTSPVTTVAIERVLTATRRALLNEIHLDSIQPPDGLLDFVSALAQQCFINEYVFDISDQEHDQVLKLRGTVSDAMDSGKPVEPIKIAILASYLPLHSIPGAEQLTSRHWPDSVRSLIAQQILNHGEEQTIRPNIERLTPVHNVVSEKVREQYEENPYPRWNKISADNQALPIDQYIRMQFPGTPYKNIGNGHIDILIAGCGTGMHAIQRAKQFKLANILAIDLSLNSLSYATRKTRELGLTNIRYAQADILALDWDKTFDVIDASGVLHHLGDPLEGWRKLAGMLRPGGLMHIGLYSALARKDINAAREHFAKQGRDYSASEVRKLRAEIDGLKQDDPLSRLTQFSDFFSMSECRDLLFHVQEHQFSIPEISAFLGQAGFTFVGFETMVRGNYLRKFPNDPAASNLENWNSFEMENPSTFAQMYQFWIQKN